MSALPINLWLGAVCGALLCACVPGGGVHAQARRQALRVLAVFVALALAPAAAYLVALFPDWSLLYALRLRAGSEATTESSTLGPPLLAALLVGGCAFLGWIATERVGRIGRAGPLARRLRRLGQLLPWLGPPPVVLRWLSVLGLALLGLALGLIVRGRLAVVGSYEQFHDGRWLMQPLLSSATKLPHALLVLNLGVLVSLGLAAHLLRWRGDLLTLTAPGLAAEAAPAAPDAPSASAADPGDPPEAPA